jgi:hypothetical protein
MAVLREHSTADPHRLLFLWNLFEGVPKFYRDCYEQQVLAADRPVLLRRIFFESSSPLRTEAEGWFLRELRGRYDVVLKEVARKPGRSHGELVSAIREAGGKSDTQIGGYLQGLCDKYQLIAGKLPVFAKPEAVLSDRQLPPLVAGCPCRAGVGDRVPPARSTSDGGGSAVGGRRRGGAGETGRSTV